MSHSHTSRPRLIQHTFTRIHSLGFGRIRYALHSAYASYRIIQCRHHSRSDTTRIHEQHHTAHDAFSYIQLHSGLLHSLRVSFKYIQGPGTVRLQHSPHSLRVSYSCNSILSHSKAFKMRSIHFMQHSIQIRWLSHTRDSQHTVTAAYGDASEVLLNVSECVLNVC